MLEEMNRQIVHRGPDDDGFFVERNVGLAMRRLSIIDIRTGHQPISNEDENIWIVYNGEIYNHQQLRADLEARGHRYRTKSDTETIVHLYEEYGRDCVKHLRGMFAFAIWDRRTRHLFIGRDRLGIKPLYYRYDGKTDRQILRAYRWLAAREGVFVEPASAASVAGLLDAHDRGLLAPGQTVVCTVTGHGLKDPQWAIDGAPAPRTVTVDAHAAAALLGLDG